MRKRIIFSFILALSIGFTLFAAVIPANAGLLNQQPTGSIPTVTGTPTGVMATVNLDQAQVNIRSGPGRFYEQVGVLLAGQSVPALGRSSGGDWVLVEYVGIPGNEAWVYSPYVTLTPGELPIIEPPPTPTPEMTLTINPTLAAQFVVTPNPTLLPTFTPSSPLEIPTYTDSGTAVILGGVPMGLVILIIAGIGIILSVIAYLQGH